MTALPKVANLGSPDKAGDLLLGEDWVSHDAMGETALRAGRRRRRIVSLNRSPLARKIIIFNLMALVVLVAGVLFFNPFRDSLVLQREQGLVTQAQLIAQTFDATLVGSSPPAPHARGCQSRRSRADKCVFRCVPWRP